MSSCCRTVRHHVSTSCHIITEQHFCSTIFVIAVSRPVKRVSLDSLHFFIHSADSRSRPVVITIFTHLVRTRTSPLISKSSKTKQISSENQGNNLYYWRLARLWVWSSGSWMTAVLFCFLSRRSLPGTFRSSNILERFHLRALLEGQQLFANHQLPVGFQAALADPGQVVNHQHTRRHGTAEITAEIETFGC